MKALWKESQTLLETTSKETNKAGAAASKSLLRVIPAAITEFNPDNYIDKQIYVGALKSITVATALVMCGYD